MKKYCEYCGKYFICNDKRTRFCSKECGYNNRRMLKDQNVQNLRLHRIYNDMKFRCYHFSSKDYKYYGARGIKICQEWLDSFLNFYNWAIQSGYKENLTIDRIDNNGNYCPENCRWVDLKIQSNNKSNTIKITYKNKTLSVSEWAKLTGLNYNMILRRYLKGLSVEEIFTKPSRNKNKTNNKSITFNGKCLCGTQWDKELNFPKGTVRLRLSRGWSIEKTLTTPIDKRFSSKKDV